MGWPTLWGPPWLVKNNRRRPATSKASTPMCAQKFARTMTIRWCPAESSPAPGQSTHLSFGIRRLHLNAMAPPTLLPQGAEGKIIHAGNLRGARQRDVAAPEHFNSRLETVLRLA